ncbi:protein phosphatase CheZ [Oleidesulfovibrio sp.]|uniref:protein phosphatase CheZ n=1 Tax=Oleidesulfovibrio sp. TaxID=2909707 RepID=UPI003A83E961
MRSQEAVLEQVMQNVTAQVADSIKDAIAQTIQNELTANLTRALLEGEFYKKINSDMRSGLQNIYQEISHAAKDKSAAPPSEEQTDKLFSEASEQLDEILTTTKQATDDIMDVVEQQLERQAEAAALLDELEKEASPETIAKLRTFNSELGDNLSSIMTALSFQDLTGQRIKKIITALQRIEGTVFELYMSTGLIMKAHDESPDKELAELEQETKQRMSELKGPTRDVSQSDIDDMLAQLGLD